MSLTLEDKKYLTKLFFAAAKHKNVRYSGKKLFLVLERAGEDITNDGNITSMSFPDGSMLSHVRGRPLWSTQHMPQGLFAKIGLALMAKNGGDLPPQPN